MKVSSFQFNHIFKEMEKEFGKIKKDQEEGYGKLLFPMEANVLKTYRTNDASNSRRLTEALAITLFQIKSYLSDETYELDNYKSEDNERLVHALLMAFDPFTNEEIRKVIERDHLFNLDNREEWKTFYKAPIICLLRIKKSVETWEKRMGANGYFDFLNNMVGSAIPQDEEFEFSIIISEDF